MLGNKHCIYVLQRFALEAIVLRRSTQRLAKNLLERQEAEVIGFC